MNYHPDRFREAPDGATATNTLPSATQLMHASHQLDNAAKSAIIAFHVASFAPEMAGYYAGSAMRQLREAVAELGLELVPIGDPAIDMRSGEQ